MQFSITGTEIARLQVEVPGKDDTMLWKIAKGVFAGFLLATASPPTWGALIVGFGDSLVKTCS
jgi:hypothetical protein